MNRLIPYPAPHSNPHTHSFLNIYSARTYPFFIFITTVLVSMVIGSSAHAQDACCHSVTVNVEMGNEVMIASDHSISGKESGTMEEKTGGGIRFRWRFDYQPKKIVISCKGNAKTKDLTGIRMFAEGGRIQTGNCGLTQDWIAYVVAHRGECVLNLDTNRESPSKSIGQSEAFTWTIMDM